MNRLAQVLLLALLILAVIGLAGGCAPKAGALRSDRGEVEVRMPLAEAVGLEMSAERPDLPRPEPPYSIADEDRGRWLMLFEVNITPSETAGPPPGPAPSP